MEKQFGEQCQRAKEKAIDRVLGYNKVWEVCLMTENFPVLENLQSPKAILFITYLFCHYKAFLHVLSKSTSLQFETIIYYPTHNGQKIGGKIFLAC